MKQTLSDSNSLNEGLTRKQEFKQDSHEISN